VTFANPFFLRLGLVVAIVVVAATWNHARRRRRLARHLGGLAAATRLSRSSLYRLRLERMALLGLVAVAMAGAAAEPEWVQVEEVSAPAPARTVVLAIDISASMQATDELQTRLSRAVEIARETVTSLPESRVGLMLFAGSVYRLVPPTLDHTVPLFFLDGLVPALASADDPGTLLSVAIDQAVALASVAEGESSVILLSDGETPEAGEVVLAAVQAAADREIVVHTVGFGGSEDAEMVMPRTRYQYGGPVLDPSGAPAVSRSDETLMTRISEVGRGNHAHAYDRDALRRLSRSFDVPQATPAKPRTDLGRLFTLVALAALFLESLLDVRLTRRAAAVPRMA
jgi:Ca-activated chloride channel homolog